jgi:ABC-type phosphate transport system substrate-binding protein
MKTKIVFGLIFATLVWMVFTLPNVASAGTVVVIANENAPASSLSRADVKNIFLAKKTQWDNGQKINLATLKKSQTHDYFLRKYLQKSPSQFQRYFKTLLFTGKGKIPKSFNSEADLVRYVASTDGAIGYVSSETDTGSVKVINVN